MMLCPQSAVYREIVRSNEIGPLVLEVGFGTGAQVVQYAHKANWVTATEVDENAVEWAEKQWPLPNVEWIEKDICDSVTKPMFDTIFAIEVIEHVSDPEQAMANMANLLKASGTAWISVPRGVTKNELHRTAWTELEFVMDLSKHFTRVETHQTWPSLMLAEVGYA